MLLSILAIPHFFKKIYVDPTNSNSNITSRYDEQWQVLSNTTGILKLKTYNAASDKQAFLGNISFFLYETSAISPSMKETKAYIYLIDGKYSNSPVARLLANGRHFTDTNKGFLQVIIPSRFQKNPGFTMNETDLQTLYDQAHDPTQSWPNDSQTVITQEQIDQVNNISVSQCVISYFYEIQSVEMSDESLVYPVDIRLNYQDYTVHNHSKFYPKITSTLISQNCAFNFNSTGEIHSISSQIKRSFTYSVPMIIFNFLSVLSGLRFLQLLQSETRLRRISLPTMLLITVFDYALAFLHLTFSITIPNSALGLVLCSVLNFISATFVDISVLTQVFRARQAARGQMNNPRNMCRMVLMLYLGFFIYLIIKPYIPAWGTFILVILASSCWALQIVYSFLSQDPGKAFPIDFLASQSIVKYAPVMYFYCYEGNFMHEEVMTWYPYVGGCWCGVQILAIFVQFFVGNRFGVKRSYKNELEYDYAAQKIKQFVVMESRGFVEIDAVLADFQAKKCDFDTFLEDKILVIFELQTQAKNTENSENEGLESSIESDSICMNPAHSHSKFFGEKCAKSSENCFYAFEKAQTENIVICSICIDFIDLEHVENSNQFLVSAPKNLNPQSMLWMPPCGHCFHRECLSRWANENLQCPVDRGVIPPVGEGVWYE